MRPPPYKTATQQAIYRTLVNGRRDDVSTDDLLIAKTLLYIAAGEPPTARVSTWVAAQMFDVTAGQWLATLKRLTRADIITYTWDETHTRATITFQTEEQESQS